MFNVADVKGFTLIELMLALTLSSLILTMVTSIYLTAEKNVHMQAALSNIQENAQIAGEFLRTDLRLAGYMGCAKLTDDFPMRSFSSYALTTKNKITYQDKKLTVRHASLVHANLTEGMQDFMTLHLTSSPTFSVGNILVVSDCKSAEIIRVERVMKSKDGQVIVSLNPLVKRYDQQAEVSQLEFNTYSVEDTGRKTKALYLTSELKPKPNRTELVEGVEEMEVEFRQGVLLNLTFVSGGIRKKWYDFISLV